MQASFKGAVLKWYSSKSYNAGALCYVEPEDIWPRN
jgi:hypothetical protein